MSKGEKTKLLLLTQRFPYSPGEQFLETEIEFLCQTFDEVHIIPIAVTNPNSIIREIPDNAIVHPMFMPTSKIGKIFGRIRHLLFDSQGIKYLFKGLHKAREKGNKAIAVLANWISLAIPIRNRIKELYVQINGDKNTIFYSYWLNPAALALSMMKEKTDALYSISRAHGGDLYEYRHNPSYLPLQYEVAQSMDAIFLISEDGRRYLANKYPSLTNLYLSRLGTKGVCKRTEPSTDNVLRIATCSYMVPVKRLSLLADALKLCKNSIEWHHIGDGPERGNVEQKVEHFPSHVHFIFHGSLGNDEVKKYYQENPIDLFINVSESEGIPVSIMEAFSCGIPAIATNVGGTSELVTEYNGILIDKEITPEKLAQLIDEFANFDLGSRRKMAEAAYDMWKNHYNATKNYQQFSETLKNIGEINSHDTD